MVNCPSGVRQPHRRRLKKVAMAMYCGLTGCIADPCDQRLMETIKTCDIIKNNTRYADACLQIQARENRN